MDLTVYIYLLGFPVGFLLGCLGQWLLLSRTQKKLAQGVGISILCIGFVITYGPELYWDYFVKPSITTETGSGVGFGYVFLVDCSKASIWFFFGLAMGVHTFILRKYWKREAVEARISDPQK